MIIVTGASNNHYNTLKQFIDSVIKFRNIDIQLIVYDLGIETSNWNNLITLHNVHYNISFKTFDYTKYPSWYNININAGEYAWKSAIIYETYLEHTESIIMWMDAGNIITSKLNPLVEFIKINGVHTGVTSGDIKLWTHPKTLEYMKPSNLNMPNRNGAAIGFNCKIQWVKDFLEEFYNCCCDKNCIAPEGSSRINHRQDQAVLTILFYKYLEKYKFGVYSHPLEKWNTFLCYTIHNDI